MKETTEERVNGLEINLQELLLTYLRKWWVIVLCFALGAAIALGYTIRFVTPMYRTSVSIYVNNKRAVEDLSYLTSADLSASQSLVNTYISIAKSDRVLEKIAEKLGGDYTAETLSQITAASQYNGTEIFRIYAVHSDPEEAARIANVAAEVAPAELSSIIEGTSARVIDEAKVPKVRYSPSYQNAVIYGGLVGLMVALVVLTALCLSDTRIKDENDLVSMFALPVLGRIPDFEYTATQSSYGYGSSDEDDENDEGAESAILAKNSKKSK